MSPLRETIVTRGASQRDTVAGKTPPVSPAPLEPGNGVYGTAGCVAAAACAGFIGAVGGVPLGLASADAPTLWLGNAVVVAIALRRSCALRPLLLVSLMLGLVLGSLAAGLSAATGTMLASLAMLEVLIVLGVLRWLEGPHVEVTRWRPLLRFLVIAGLLAPGVLAAVVMLLRLAGIPAVRSISPSSWYVTHALGMIAIVPATSSLHRTDLRHLTGVRALAETAAILVLTCSVTAAVMWQPTMPLLFCVLPCLILAAFRLRFSGAALTLLSACAIAIPMTFSGYGPVAHAFPDAEARVLFIEFFIAVAVLTTLPVASLLADRGRLLRSLSEGEARFRSLARVSPAGIFRIDPDGWLTYGNEGFDREIGLDRSAGAHWTSIIAPEDRSAALDKWLRAAETPTRFDGEVQVIRRDDGASYYRLALAPEIDDAGAATGWIGTLADIDATVVARQALAVANRRFEAFAAHSRDLIMQINPLGMIMFATEAAIGMIGRAPAELVGENIADLLHPDDRPRVMRSLSGSSADADGHEMQCRLMRRDGSTVWIEAVIGRFGFGEGLMVNVRDISRRHESERLAGAANARIEESHRLLTMAEELAGLGHWRLDGRSEEVFWSDQVYRIHGRDLADRPDLEAALSYYHPDDRAGVDQAVEAALDAGTPFAFSVRIVRGDGSLRHVQSQGQVERDATGKVCGLFGVFQDVTEQVLARAELTKARDEARVAADAKSAFLATMSHEIRTPMTGVLGMIELLRADPPAEERDRFFDCLERSASLLMAVLDDVLDFSKIESGKLQIEDVPFDLAEVVQGTIQLFRGEASKKGLPIELRMPPGRHHVSGDPVRVQQIISNLVSNAIKFTEHGRIDLVADRRDGSDMWLLTVCDTGIGIPADRCGELFSPFVQADTSTTRRFGGTGLGLSISRRLAEAMGGGITVSSEPGIGSVFRVEVRLPEASEPLSRPDVEASACGNLRVLVAEDNPVNRLLVTTLLERAGHSCLSVEDGRAAVAAVALERFDIVLMDMQMPVMDGVEATRAIRAAGDDLPIFALTADASPERRPRYLEAGLTGFLTKPIDTAALMRTLAGTTPRDLDRAPSVGVARLLDAHHLSETEDSVGEANLLILLHMFLDELTTRPQQIAELIGRRQWSEARREAHALKGAASSLGAHRTSAAAAAVEAADDENAMAAAQAALKAAAHETGREVVEWLGRRKAA